MGKNKYGDITKEKLDNELNSNIGSTNYSSTLVDDGIEVTFTNSGRTYIVDSDGNVEKKTPSIEITEAKVVTNSNGTGEDVTANSKIEETDILYISFKPIISGGSITSVTYNGNTITAQNGIYVLEVSKNGDYSFTINATAEGKIITTPYTKNVDKYQLWGGIEIGDYVTYVPPTNNGTLKSYSLTAGASGYSSNQTLTQQYNIWRVLSKEDEKLEIMPAFKDGITYTTIYFQDAKGWNNAPYLLDDMCSELYSNETNGITARSIDYEDITSRMIDGIEGTNSSNSTGLKKIQKWQSERVAAISGGTYIDSINTTANIITYKTRTLYPTAYPYVKDDLSNPYYTSNTLDTNSSSNGRITNKPATLQIKYSAYTGEVKNTDFLNNNAYSVIFGTQTQYWIASRCVHCQNDGAYFEQRLVDRNNLSRDGSFYTNGFTYNKPNYKIAPVVTLSSNVQVTKCTGANTQNNRHIVVIQD